MASESASEGDRVPCKLAECRASPVAKLATQHLNCGLGDDWDPNKRLRADSRSP